MKLIAKSLLSAVLTGALAGSGSVWAAPVVGGNDQILTQVSTYSGNGEFGGDNNDLLTSSFRMPEGILVLSDGSLLISDSRNHVIRKVAKNQISFFTGPGAILNDKSGNPLGGLNNGKKQEAFFQEPAGLAEDAKGNVYVADSANHAIRKIDSAGNVTTIAGNGAMGSKDGKGAEATFNTPKDIAVTSDGTVFVADALNHVIRKILTDGTVTTLTAPSTRAVQIYPGVVIPGGDFKDGLIKDSKFNEPSGLAVDAKGNLFISDSGNQRIRYMDFQAGTVTTVAGGGEAGKELYVPGDFVEGSASAARFNAPRGIALTADGGILIADSLNHSIRYLKDGKVSTLAGDLAQYTGEHDGVDRASGFQRPTDVVIAKDGSILVADTDNNKIRKINYYNMPTLPNDKNVKVVVGNELIEFDAQPEIVNGRTMIPVRFVIEKLGYDVKFFEDKDVRTVKLSKGDLTIELTLDQTGIKRVEKGKTDVAKQTDVAPYIKEDRTYVPIRFFAEEIGLDVQWNDETRTVIVRTK